jgi:uncharacterized membrane protein
VATVDTTPAPRTGFRFSLLTLSWIIEIIGTGITGYMTYAKLFGQVLPCTNEGFVNCTVVESSAWAWIIGIPTAAWGLFSHVIIITLLLLAMRNAFMKQNGVLLVFGVTLFAALYHTYLTYVSVTILRALCPWCLAAATCMYLQLIVTGIRMRNTLRA